MARSNQTARKARRGPVIHSHKFVDHAGTSATRYSWHFEDHADEREKSPFNFQIYSTVPLEGDLLKLFNYLGGGLDGFFPTFEIYPDEQPDIFSCVDHQRREIAHRKASIATSDPLPLIPKFVENYVEHRRHGLLIMITSTRYTFLTNDLDPEGPVWVCFERNFPHKAIADTTSRLENSPELARSVGCTLEEIEVLPEKPEIRAQRIQNVPGLRTLLPTMCKMRYLDDMREVPDFGLDEDEGQPLDQLEKTTDTLLSQAQALSLDLKFVSGPEEAITVTSKAMTSECNPDLRYVVYAPFLGYAGMSELDTLKDTARTFSSTLTSHLPNKTIHLEFHKPPQPTLSSTMSYHQALMKSRPEMSVGALHNVQLPQSDSTTTPYRAYPCTQNENHPFWPDIERYETFVVVLDKPNFVEEAGVLFVMTDGGKMKTNPEDE